MFGANYLTILLKPNYEKPIDSPQDIYERGLTVIWPPGWELYAEMVKNDTENPDPNGPKIAEVVIVPKVIFCYIEQFPFKFIFKNWDEYDEWIEEKIVKTGSSVLERSFLFHWELEWAIKANTAWHRSKYIKPEMNFASYMLNKKWNFEEEFNNHMLRFQQVTVQRVYLFQ